MKIFRCALLLLLAAAAFQACVIPESDRGSSRDRYDDRYASCGRDHRLSVVDLDMVPDPVREGDRIRGWRVRLRADASGECETTLRIRERRDGDLVGLARVSRLRPGMNDINFDPVERYRFSRGEHCFEVVADIAGTGRSVDAARAFCARERPGRRWSLK